MGYAWRSHAETARAKRVRRSLSEAKAKTDWSHAETARAKRVRRSLSEAKAKTDWSHTVWYVYIIRSEAVPEHEYTGATADLKRRLSGSQLRKSKHTAKYIPNIFHGSWFDIPHFWINIKRWILRGI